MRRVLGAVFFILCMLMPFHINEAGAQSGICANFAKANHCYARYDHRIYTCVCR